MTERASAGVVAVDYIHGTGAPERARLSALNGITNARFIEYLHLSGTESIADFGCGLGQLDADIAERYPGVRITGIDRADEYCAVARQRTSGFPSVAIHRGDVHGTAFPDGTFDVTFCRYVLEHAAAPAAVAREMIRVTRPGGRVVVQENDLHNVLYDPAIPGHADVLRAYCALQMQMGGDPFVGRKLFSFFDVDEIADLTLELSPEICTARDPERYRAWVGNSRQILATARDALVRGHLVAADVVDRVIAEMDARRAAPKGVSLFHWNRLTARKRGDGRR